MLSALLCFLLVPTVRTSTEPVPISIDVYDVAGVEEHILEQARQEIASIYARAGMALRWTTQGPDAPYSRELDNPLRSVQLHRREPCAGAPTYSIAIQISRRFPQQFRPHALAFSLPFAPAGVRVTVFYDRVQSAARRSGVAVARVLAAMLAHEIGHVLLGNDAHFESSIMRECWGLEDFDLLRKGLPHFGRREIRLMHNRVDRWRQSCGAAPLLHDAGGG